MNDSVAKDGYNTGLLHERVSDGEASLDTWAPFQTVELRTELQFVALLLIYFLLPYITIIF